MQLKPFADSQTLLMQDLKVDEHLNTGREKPSIQHKRYEQKNLSNEPMQKGGIPCW